MIKAAHRAARVSRAKMRLHWISCSSVRWCRECICISYSKRRREREEKVSRDATKTPMHITNKMTATIYTEANEKRKQIDSLHSIKVHFYVPSSLKKTYLHANFCHDQRECSVQRARKGKRNCRRILIFRRHCKLFAWVLVMLNAVVSNHNRRWNNQTENSINM